ncbi:hypothetical protein CFRS1_v003670 [Colletotrichum fructicola]|nr:hypothetical protein CFRS1_v003670 [Colletotrichum fructicola]
MLLKTLLGTVATRAPLLESTQTCGTTITPPSCERFKKNLAEAQNGKEEKSSVPDVGHVKLLLSPTAFMKYINVSPAGVAPAMPANVTGPRMKPSQSGNACGPAPACRSPYIGFASSKSNRLSLTFRYSV